MSLPEPITRKEQYYDGIARGNASKLPEPITREEQYLEYIAKNGGGGGGGTTDYEALDNKPSVNSVELSGNKTLDDLGIQGKLTFDNEPTEDSQNPVKSGGVYEVLESLVDAISEKPDEYADLTDKPSINSVELSGNKTASDLGLQAELDGAQTVEGNPITIADAESMNAEGVIVELEPKQDLHGYDAPWVGGSGKNKLPLVLADIKTVNTSGTWSGNTYTLNGVTFEVLTDSADNVLGVKVNGTASASTNFGLTDKLGDMSGLKYNGAGAGTTNNKCLIVGYWDAQGEWIGDGRAYGGNDYTLLDYPQMSFGIYVQNTQTLTDETFYPMIRLSTESDPTFTPYSNICPITGYSEVNVERVGKNWLDTDNVTGYTQDVDGYVTKNEPSSDARQWNYTSAQYKTILPIGDYKLVYQIKTTTSNVNSGLRVFDAENNELANAGYIPFQIAGTYTITFSLSKKTNIGVMCKQYDAVLRYMITPQSASNDYVPYQGNTYTIDLGGTKYGGTLDVTSGVLNVDRAEVDLGDLSWGQVSTNTSGKYRYQATVSDMNSQSTVIASGYGEVSLQDTYRCNDGIYAGENNVIIYDSTKDTLSASDFKTAVTGQQLVYELATPLTIQLTPTQIQMLENTNNISTNGTNIQLKYQPNNVIGECKVYTDEKCSEVLPPLPTTDGTYHLSCEVTSGVGMLSWVSDS